MLEESLKKGRSLFQRHDFQEAFEELSKAIGIIENEKGGEWLGEERLAEVYLMRGTALLALNEREAYEDPDIFNQIIDDFDQVLEIAPEHIEAFALRGRLYLNCTFTDYQDEALQDFQEVLRRDRDHWETLNLMGQLFFTQKEFDKAIYYFSLVIQAQPTVAAYEIRALSYYQRLPPEYALAAADFEQAKQLNPEREEFYIWRSQCFQEMGLIHDAITEYNQLLEINSGEAKYWIDRGTLKMEEDPDGALADFDQALEIRQDPIAYNNRAFYYKEKGLYDQAIEDAKMALEVNPKATIAFATLAEIYAELNEEEAFYYYLEEALKQYFDDIVDARSEAAFQKYAHSDRFLELLEAYNTDNKT